jgi:cytochrome c oxidase assembly protein subunit 15
MTMIFVLRSKNSVKSTRVFSVVASAVVFGQIALGATVITEKLHAVLVTAHLALGLALYSSLVFVVINTYYTNLRLKTSSASVPTSATTTTTTNSLFNEKKPSVEYSPNEPSKN